MVINTSLAYLRDCVQLLVQLHNNCSQNWTICILWK